MKREITLNEIYESVTREFPSPNHNPKLFQENIINFLNKDPRRTSGVRRIIELEGLNYTLKRIHPLNEFINATYGYLLTIGFSEEKASEFQRRYIHENDFLFT